MNIQSLSIVVPARSCINNCKFCCVKMCDDKYKNQLDSNLPFYDLYQEDYLKRLDYARDNGCNTVMLTGDCEPQQNRSFLEKFGTLNKMLQKPFRNIEMQTTGALLNEGYLRFLRNHVGVTTISVSVSCIIDDNENNDIIGTSEKSYINLEWLCGLIKKYDFNLRLSLNVTTELFDFESLSADWIVRKDIERLFDRCKELGANQVTFRKMYESHLSETEQNQWIKEHTVDCKWFDVLKDMIYKNGNYLDTLEYGSRRYSYNEMSVVIDEDCMSKGFNDNGIKYLILRPDCKLYTKWDDKGSLVF